jgi:hypothetical protein
MAPEAPNLPTTLKDHFGRDASDYSISMTNDQMRLVDKYLNAIEEACYRRKFFSTRGGKIGTGLLLMQPGDKACVFRTAEMPLILRKEPG